MLLHTKRCTHRTREVGATGRLPLWLTETPRQRCGVTQSTITTRATRPQEGRVAGQYGLCGLLLGGIGLAREQDALNPVGIRTLRDRNELGAERLKIRVLIESAAEIKLGGLADGRNRHQVYPPGLHRRLPFQLPDPQRNPGHMRFDRHHVRPPPGRTEPDRPGSSRRRQRGSFGNREPCGSGSPAGAGTSSPRILLIRFARMSPDSRRLWTGCRYGYPDGLLRPPSRRSVCHGIR